MIPKFYKDLPRGSSVFVDRFEYERIMKDKQKIEENFLKGLSKAKKKNNAYYEIKTPLPADKHTVCTVCNVKY
jgi:hypothetical protein